MGFSFFSLFFGFLIIFFLNFQVINNVAACRSQKILSEASDSQIESSFLYQLFSNIPEPNARYRPNNYISSAIRLPNGGGGGVVDEMRVSRLSSHEPPTPTQETDTIL